MLETERLGFAGHETFPFRMTWLPKAYRWVKEMPSILSDTDTAVVKLGVGKNMVRSIRHWALACGVLEESQTASGIGEPGLRPTIFGASLLDEQTGWDPYLEDPASLWTLHWKLATNPTRSATWHYAFNVYPRPSFSRDDLLNGVAAWASSQGHKVSGKTLARDIDCFVRCYFSGPPSRSVPLEDTLACPLSELRLLTPVDKGRSFSLDRGDWPSLPDEIFAAVLCDFLDRRATHKKTVNVDEIVSAPGSPSRIFLLTEDALVRRLEGMEHLTKGAILYNDTAGERRLSLGGIRTPIEFVSRYFQSDADREQTRGAA